jgi:hypothetical protein
MLKNIDEGLTVAEVLEPLGWTLSEDHTWWCHGAARIAVGAIEGLLRTAGKQRVIQYAQQEASRCR